MGDCTRRFEEGFARLCNVEYAVAVNSGTSALEIAYRYLSLKPGDEVLVPTDMFSATAATVIFASGKPVLTESIRRRSASRPMRCRRASRPGREVW